MPSNFPIRIAIILKNSIISYPAHEYVHKRQFANQIGQIKFNQGDEIQAGSCPYRMRI
jgi:hypothetical protein